MFAMFPPEFRTCGRCDESKPIFQFNWRRARRGQRDNLCRACRALYKEEHYQANKQRYVDQARQRKQALARQRTAFLLGYFTAHPCTDCGEEDPVVLEFDHLRDKLKNISAMANSSQPWEKILSEIAKCEVVCANCHRRRTARRQGSLRSQLAAIDRQRL